MRRSYLSGRLTKLEKIQREQEKGREHAMEISTWEVETVEVETGEVPPSHAQGQEQGEAD